MFLPNYKHIYNATGITLWTLYAKVYTTKVYNKLSLRLLYYLRNQSATSICCLGKSITERTKEDQPFKTMV